MPGLSLKLIGAERIIRALTSKQTVKRPMERGIREITLKMEGLTKKATVVDYGRLKSSITHRFAGSRGYVGTNVQYASFIEYGTRRMEARHMEGGMKRLGRGMFDYALELLHKWMGKAEGDIARKIEDEF